MLNGIAKFFRESYWARFLIPGGLVLMIFSIFVFNAVNHSKGFIKTKAVVSKTELYETAYIDAEGNTHEETFTVYVKYSVDNIEYEKEFGVFSGYKTGDELTICYNPDNPNEITQPNGMILPIAILTAGIASFVGGIISIIVAVKKHKALKEQEKEWQNGN